MARLIYLLDTNILSEPTKKQPNPNVLAKIQKYEDYYATSATVWQELRFGCERLPLSKFRSNLEGYLNILLQNDLPILPFETRAAEWLGIELAKLMNSGISVPYADAQIAAVAVVNNLVLVTRNTADFKYFSNLTLDNWFE